MHDAAICCLSDYPFQTVRLACSRCDRQARFNRERLIAEHGASATMLDMCDTLAQCRRRGTRDARCGAFYPDLMLD